MAINKSGPWLGGWINANMVKVPRSKPTHYIRSRLAHTHQAIALAIVYSENHSFSNQESTAHWREDFPLLRRGAGDVVEFFVLSRPKMASPNGGIINLLLLISASDQIVFMYIRYDPISSCVIPAILLTFGISSMVGSNYMNRFDNPQ